MKYYLLFFVVINFPNHNLVGQSLLSSSGIKIKIEIPRLVRDNKDLNAKITIINASDISRLVYAELIEGISNKGFVNDLINLTVVVQNKRGNVFKDYSNVAFIEAAPNHDTVDNLKRASIGPHDSLTNNVHIDNRYQFEMGNYRLKVLYWNNIHSDATIESNWTYFKVAKRIYIKHYYGKQR